MTIKITGSIQARSLMAEAVEIWDQSAQSWIPGELGPGWVAGVDWAPDGDELVIHQLDEIQVELTWIAIWQIPTRESGWSWSWAGWCPAGSRRVQG